MGLRERQHEKVDRRAEQFLRDKLHSGEVIEGVTPARSARFGLELLVGVLACFATTYCYLVLTNLRRVGDGQTIRFRAQRSTWRATERVTEVARVVREARGGLPG